MLDGPPYWYPIGHSVTIREGDLIIFEDGDVYAASENSFEFWIGRTISDQHRNSIHRNVNCWVFRATGPSDDMEHNRLSIARTFERRPSSASWRQNNPDKIYPAIDWSSSISWMFHMLSNPQSYAWYNTAQLGVGTINAVPTSIDQSANITSISFQANPIRRSLVKKSIYHSEPCPIP